MAKKTQRVRVYGGYTEDATFFSMDHIQFTSWIGGLLAVALFEGKFKQVVFDCISYSYARGVKYGVENSNKCKN